MKYLHSTASSQGMEDHADLEGFRVNGVTIQVDITITGQKPDLVIINRNSIPPEVTLVELTVPWESSSRLKKTRKEVWGPSFRRLRIQVHQYAARDWHKRFYKHQEQGSVSTLSQHHQDQEDQKSHKEVQHLAFLVSFMIWNSGHSEDWNLGGYLNP